MPRTKLINFDLYQLSLPKDDGRLIKDLIKDNLLTNEKFNGSNGPISKYGDFDIHGTLIQGTMCHSQMLDIPPSIDVTTNKIEELELRPEQGLAYLTSFIFDTETSIIIYESNKNGVSFGSFCDYLSYCFGVTIISELVLNPADLERLQGWTQVTKFHVKVARLQNGTILDANKKAVRDVVQLASDTDANILETKITIGRSRLESLRKGRIIELVKSFIPYKDTEEVQFLEVSGREGDESVRPIDFIKNRIRLKIYVEKKRFTVSFSIKDKYDEMNIEYLKIRHTLIKAYKK